MSAGQTQSPSAPAPKVFISYRRQDSAAYAGRLWDVMVARFGERNVFMDVDLEPGVDFVDRITEAVSECRILLEVIGPAWATTQDAEGELRLADPEDFVRLELETALRRPDVTVIPVLVGGAQMPAPRDLPPEVRAVTRRNALELSHERWRSDVGRLVKALERLLAEITATHGTQVPPDAASASAASPAEATSAQAPSADTPTAPPEKPIETEPVRTRPVETGPSTLRSGKIEAPAGVYGVPSPERSAATEQAAPAETPAESARPSIFTATSAASAWLRGHLRLTIALAVVVIAGVAVAILALGGGSTPVTEAGLPEAIPANIRPTCNQARTTDASNLGANVEYSCKPPYGENVSSGGSLSYLQFRDAKASSQGLHAAKLQVKHAGYTFCELQTHNQIQRYYPDGDAWCVRSPTDQHLEIAWDIDTQRSPVMGTATFAAPTTKAAALNAWENIIGSG